MSEQSTGQELATAVAEAMGWELRLADNCRRGWYRGSEYIDHHEDFRPDANSICTFAVLYRVFRTKWTPALDDLRREICKDIIKWAKASKAAGGE